jgi:acyl-CoA synthetase (AMP-forming)/AMP-acid ligase II
MAVPDISSGELTVTERLLGIARARSGHRALVGGCAAGTYSYGDLAATVQAAAAGLAGRGLQPRDVVGVYAPDAACYALAAYAIRAAGGIPSPVSAALTVAEIAAQLADCGARMMLTGPPLAAAAQAAADRSWVRQIISFGESAGATTFDALLGIGLVLPVKARPHDLALLPYSRKPDGMLGAAPVTHDDLANQLRRLDAEAGICARDVVLAAPPAGDGRAYTALLDHALTSGATVVAVRPDEIAAAASAHHGTLAILAGGQLAGTPGQLRVLAVAS